MPIRLPHRLILSSAFLALLALPIQATAADPSADPRLALWPAAAPVEPAQPGAAPRTEAQNAWLSVHLAPADKANGASLVICPGGGYAGRVVGPEGHGIAQWLNAHGIAGLVLEYRLPRGQAFVPLLDAQRAIRLARAHAAQWKLDPQRVGIIGFSAGGHLAATAATHFDPGNPQAADPLDRPSCRPDFAILVYPVVTMDAGTHRGSFTRLLGDHPTPQMIRLFSNEKQVTEHTPPTFLAHAKDDRVVPPANSRDLHAALVAHHVASEYLELPQGGHGLNGYHGPMWDAWQKRAIAWLAEQKFIPPAP